MGKLILIAEDEPDISLILEEMLQPLGEIETASDWQKAYQLLSTKRYDLGIVDYSSKINGIGLFQKLKQEGKELPAFSLLCTNAYPPELHQTAKAAGLKGIIEKPFDARQLREICRKVLEEGHLPKSNSNGQERCPSAYHPPFIFS